ncbi:MAG TPA: hypothetical protein VK666_29275 [Chryseolinea sp.]|nr:hypothetical protein [Chryseolinea sp.]
MRSITKRFVARSAATAQGNDSPALQTVVIALQINNFKISIKFDRAVAVYCNFCCAHLFLLV